MSIFRNAKNRENSGILSLSEDGWERGVNIGPKKNICLFPVTG